MKYRKASRKTQNIDDYNIEIPIEEKEKKIDSQKLVDDIKLYIGKLPLEQKTYAQRFYFDNVSQRNMSKEYGINRIHIARGINTVTKNLRINFNKDDYKTE